MRKIMSEADHLFALWWRGMFNATDLEIALLDLGFYNVEFPKRGHPCTAVYLGVKYNIGETNG